MNIETTFNITHNGLSSQLMRGFVLFSPDSQGHQDSSLFEKADTAGFAQKFSKRKVAGISMLFPPWMESDWQRANLQPHLRWTIRTWLFFSRQFRQEIHNCFLFFVLAVLGLHCCTQAFSSCSEQGLLFVAVRGLLIAVASLVAEHGL